MASRNRNIVNIVDIVKNVEPFWNGDNLLAVTIGRTVYCKGLTVAWSLPDVPRVFTGTITGLSDIGGQRDWKEGHYYIADVLLDEPLADGVTQVQFPLAREQRDGRYTCYMKNTMHKSV